MQAALLCCAPSQGSAPAAAAAIAFPCRPSPSPCRHSSLALVCREWAQLVHSSPLLGSLDIALCSADEGRLLARLRALVEWMARRAAGHVQQLRLEVALKHGPAVGLAQGEHQELGATVAAALSLLAASLRQVRLASRGVLLPPLGPWLAPLAGLTSFELSSDSYILPVSGSLRCLTGLRGLMHPGGTCCW